MKDQNHSHETSFRQRLMRVLAHAEGHSLLEKWQALSLDPQCEVLRGPEIGLIGLRGKIGGGGSPFNVGQATVTRVTIKLAESGNVGHSMILGRAPQKAKLAAILDALCQQNAYRDKIDGELIAPLEAEQLAQDEKRRAETASTKVDFFTLVRGDD